jgi:cytochrome P450
MAPTRDPPGPRARYPGGNFVAFRRDPLGFLQRVARDHGDAALIRLGPQRVYLLSHPALVHELLVTRDDHFEKGVGLRRAERLLGKGLLTSEGELHRRQRRLIQPAFHRRRLDGYGEAMGAVALRTAERWAAAPGSARGLDAHREMLRLALGIAGQTLFGGDIEEEAAEIGEALGVALELFQRLATVPFAEVLERLPLPGTRRFLRARARLDRTIHRLIAERRAAGADRGDLLSLLVAAGDADGPAGAMSDAQLRDEAMTLLLAGHETTANALTWSWYLLAGHPECERRLHAEVDAVLGDRLPGASDLERLPYAGAVLAEAIRLFPPAWVIGRRAIADAELGGWRIPRGALVLVSPFLVQRDPRFYPDPERFDPERWTDGARVGRPRFAYFPFGGGPRVCIGEQFAWTEGVIALTTLARRWRLRLAHSGRPVVLQPSITLRPKFGMPMVAERRRPGLAV